VFFWNALLLFSFSVSRSSWGCFARRRGQWDEGALVQAFASVSDASRGGKSGVERFDALSASLCAPVASVFLFSLAPSSAFMSHVVPLASSVCPPEGHDAERALGRLSLFLSPFEPSHFHFKSLLMPPSHRTHLKCGEMAPRDCGAPRGVPSAMNGGAGSPKAK
jgi:hypothetical protein